MCADTVMCGFPGCTRGAPLSVGRRDEDGLSLYFDHIELLFYDAPEFHRLWAQFDVDGGEAV